MPPNDPNAYKVPGNPSSGLKDNPGPSSNPGPPIGNPGPQLTGAPLGGGMDLRQEVIAGYMSLNVAEKQKLLEAMSGDLGLILMKVMPDSIEDLIMEAVTTRPEQIGDGLTPPRAAVSSPTQAMPAPAPAGALSSAAIPQSVNPLSAIR